MAEYFGKGISVGSGFDLGANLPLDNRTIQSTIADRDAMPTIQLVEGLLVYVKENKTTYVLKGFNDDGSNRVWDPIAVGTVVEVINSLESEREDAALSAAQGRVLNTLINELKASVSSALSYKGTKNTYAELPTEGNTTGDVYNIVEAYGEVPAGTNYAWNGTEWDALGGSIDLSNYATKTDLDTQKSTYEAADLALGGRIDTLSTTVSNNKQATDQKISAIEEKLNPDNTGSLANDLKNLEESLKIKNADTTVSNGIGLTVSEDGQLGINVDTAGLAAAIDNEITHPTYTADNLKIGGENKEGSAILSTKTIKETLEELESSITSAVSGGITAVNAGDGISVEGTTNAKTIGIKLSADSALQIDNNHALTLVWEEL